MPWESAANGEQTERSTPHAYDEVFLGICPGRNPVFRLPLARLVRARSLDPLLGNPHEGKPYPPP
jgi:hypothetical protein